jgi:hypothetical protein
MSTATATAEAPAAQATPGGGSLLTSGLPEKPQEQQPANSNQPANGVEAAKQAAQRPEWAPEKYWDASGNQIKVEDLAKGYTNLEKLLGHEKIPRPANDEDQEGWDRWYAASGRPEAPDKYEFQKPEKLPETLSYDEDLEKNFRSAAHANGLNKRQATALYDQFVKHQIERTAAWETGQKQARAQVETSLRREHGAQYEAFLTSAKTAVSEYADPEFRQYLDETGLGNDPRMIRMFGRIGKELAGESRLHGKPQPTASPVDMQRAISEFRDKYKEPLWNRDHPDHALRTKEMASMYEAAFPEQRGG